MGLTSVPGDRITDSPRAIPGVGEDPGAEVRLLAVLAQVEARQLLAHAGTQAYGGLHECQDADGADRRNRHAGSHGQELYAELAGVPGQQAVGAGGVLPLWWRTHR